GGMATVYLAQDLKHDRRVAIKVLRSELAAVIGAGRFLSEIKTTANLQHPHILPLHDSGEVNGTVFYVMPFVEGESLRDRLAREKQLPIAEAVRLATEVAGALAYAHRHGIIHRDIKPENILLHDGSALVADFGIALAASAGGATSRMTETGMSLGTPSYMSPEQAMGERTLDPRTDVYALGCVLYEMLSGEPPFSGPTAQAIVARVMTETPRPLRIGRHTVPPHLDAAIARALEKLPADRYDSASAFAAALETGPAGWRPEPTAGMRPLLRTANRLTAALIGLVLIFAGLAAWGLLRPETSPAVGRYAVEFQDAYLDSDGAPAVSPDGRRFVYASADGPLILRDQGALAASPVPGAQDGWGPFFSPDGSTLGFMTGFPGDLAVVNLASGAVSTLVRDSVIAYGGSWSDDGWIYYTAGLGRNLMRIRPSGGPAELVLQADSTRDEFALRAPHVLPGGKRMLLTVWRRRGPPDIALLEIGSSSTRVLTQGLKAWYLPSGHLIVVRGDGSVAAQRFAPNSGEVKGSAVELIQGVQINSGGIPFFTVSRSGTVLYASTRRTARLVRVQRDGQASVVDPSWTGELGWPSLSPDGTRLALSSTVGGRREVWVKTLDTGPFFRVAAAGSQNYRPFWSRDGRSLGFVSDLGGLTGIYRTAADGTGGLEPIVRFSRSIDEGAWSGDGHWLVFRAGSGTGRDIFALRPGVDSVPVPLVATESEEFSPSISPDGRWLAYGADVSGQAEIFVRPFPDASA
ncbi:MAG TPA: protein kinase, partial [Actinomycetota bacterium]|nr:protein kinase [Actinomycetota bacterium]